MHLIDGKALAQRFRTELKETIEREGLHPALAVLLIGEDPASTLYVRLKREAAEAAGIRIVFEHLPASAQEVDALNLIATWNQDPAIHGILVQLPLPASFDENRIVSAIDPKKDADGFHPENTKRLLEGTATMLPPLHEGILRLINETPLKLSGSSAAIICNSATFGEPLERLLKTAGLFVTLMTPDDLDRYALRQADLVVIAIGQLEFLTGEIVKDTAVIIDVGINKTPEGKTRGDVALSTFEETDAWVTPVPGGVGPMTVAMLLSNVVNLARRSAS